MPTTKNDHTPSTTTTTTTTETARPRSVTLDTVVNVPQHPVIEGAVYCEAVTALCGAAGSGKSTIARQWAAGLSVGADWPAGKADPDNAGNTLWLGSEESAVAVRAGFDRLGVEADLSRIHYTRIDDVRAPRDLCELSIDTLADLVVVDPAADLLRLHDWNDYAAVRAAVRRWGSAVTIPYSGCGLLLLHHTNKRGAYLGSAGLAGAVDILSEWNVAPGNVRELVTVKTRVQAVAPGERTRWAFDGKRYRPAGEAPSVDRSPADDVPARVRAYLLAHPGSTKRAIGMALDIRPGGSARWAALSAAVEAGP